MHLLYTQLDLILLFSLLPLFGSNPTRTTDSTIRMPKTCKSWWWKILRINGTSSWFSLNGFYIFKKISSSFTISSPEFIWYKVMLPVVRNTLHRTQLLVYHTTARHFNSVSLHLHVYAYHPNSTTRISQERIIVNFMFCWPCVSI